jgi:hypothetical protein
VCRPTPTPLMLMAPLLTMPLFTPLVRMPIPLPLPKVSPNTFGTVGELVRNWRGFIALLFGTGAKLVRNWRGSIATLCGTGTELLRRARPPPDFGQQLARGLAAAKRRRRKATPNAEGE